MLLFIIAHNLYKSSLIGRWRRMINGARRTLRRWRGQACGRRVSKDCEERAAKPFEVAKILLAKSLDDWPRAGFGMRDTAVGLNAADGRLRQVQ